MAWKGTPEATAERATELIPSGAVVWGLDTEEEIFALYGIPYQPATVLIGADKTIFDRWAGARTEEETRAAIEALLTA
ncbi:MAG: TlpA family protein disulfide reductase [Acidimicrobiia bacterium]